MKNWKSAVFKKLVEATNCCWGRPVDMLDEKERIIRADWAFKISKLMEQLLDYEKRELLK